MLVTALKTLSMAMLMKELKHLVSIQEHLKKRERIVACIYYFLSSLCAPELSHHSLGQEKVSFFIYICRVFFLLYPLIPDGFLSSFHSIYTPKTSFINVATSKYIHSCSHTFVFYCATCTHAF